MSEIALALVIVALLVDRFLLVRATQKDQERQGAFDSTVVETIDKIHERASFQVAELTEKIQHPEVPHPRIPDTEPGPPPEPDPAYETVGRIFPESNGDSPDEGG